MKKQSAYIVCEYIFIFYIIKNILFINILNIIVALEKLKYYYHTNSNVYPITTSKFYLFYLLILIIDY